ncbi:MAG: hypothetical protein AAGG01_12095, partial [Planctomycetota bacterium]
HDANGFPLPGTTWEDRPDHDALYPDIAVPVEAQGPFTIPARVAQSLWVDVTIPRDSASGLYRGVLELSSLNGWRERVPVELEVHDMALPDQFSGKTMLYMGYGDINERHLGVRFPDQNSPQAQSSGVIRDNYFKLLRRHRVTVFDGNEGPEVWGVDRPRDHWRSKLDGSFYSAANGYQGPGEGTPHDFFVVGAYGSWNWQGGGTPAMHQRTDAWMSWFDSHAPGTEVLLYLDDEPNLGNSGTVSEIQGWLDSMASNAGPGGAMQSFLTVEMPAAQSLLSGLDICASWARVGDPAAFDPAFEHFKTDGRQAFVYNGIRPIVGSFATEDEGVALRVLAWTQFKKDIDRYFFWESTYWYSFQGCAEQGPWRCRTDLFNDAKTFGGSREVSHPEHGQTSWNYSNGDGVLLFPGTDVLFPEDSYGLDGPLASLRLKHWRRGLQDFEYLKQAEAIDPAAVDAIVQQIVPRVLWEVGVDDPNDPTYVRTDISWSTDPDVWEWAREQLVAIIEG